MALLRGWISIIIMILRCTTILLLSKIIDWHVWVTRVLVVQHSWHSSLDIHHLSNSNVWMDSITSALTFPFAFECSINHKQATKTSRSKKVSNQMKRKSNISIKYQILEIQSRFIKVNDPGLLSITHLYERMFKLQRIRGRCLHHFFQMHIWKRWQWNNKQDVATRRSLNGQKKVFGYGKESFSRCSTVI